MKLKCWSRPVVCAAGLTEGCGATVMMLRPPGAG
jgi:hypothetical protein